MSQNQNNPQNTSAQQPQPVYIQQPQPVAGQQVVYVQQPQTAVQPQPVYVQQSQPVAGQQVIYVQQPQTTMQPQTIYAQQPQATVQSQPVYVQQPQATVQPQPQVVLVQVPTAAAQTGTTAGMNPQEQNRLRKLQRKMDRAPAGLIWLIVLLVLADLGGGLAVIISLIINAVVPV
ncbi:MAG: hypothetical protein IKO32_02535 [Lachnospiraceae bacterium]|nr:hypothetical protein [Lachnospiraceae bacterium]